MRTNSPFGISPYSGKPPLQQPNIAFRNFLEINAKVKTSGNGRQLLEIPFVYENFARLLSSAPKLRLLALRSSSRRSGGANMIRPIAIQ
jgi:hypothetical protein